ncbi:malonic semialdehyde reductase [Streptomyces chromofuscus]|uniref:Malonic semialdehyde reductase n=1 Tax=Streptomyces chromofuscus TaxID=42881 RepID=A0A7M2T937_STRCW|nr:malonic semialdehyde reductase [Streptomyces chromofuscus]QOV45170.1 malonic semialdehyde reductase [Streptomyces chromofuscus]GGT33453.1 putative NADH dehydrogenase/NAD(P)H nitroreductase [Streptomyces chromofuscus]
MSVPATLPRINDEARAALFTDARTVYSFAGTPVDDETLTGIWELARWAPTAANMQPLRVLYIRTPEGKERLLPHLDEGNRPKSASAPVVAVLAVDNRFHDHIPHIVPIRPEMKDHFEGEPAQREGITSFNGPLQAGYFILAVRASGLAAGPMAGFDPAGIDKEFFPDSDWRSILVVNIGHPAGAPEFDRMPRLAHEHVLTWA